MLPSMLGERPSAFLRRSLDKARVAGAEWTAAGLARADGV